VTDSNNASSMPFNGYKVLDFTQIISGPLATQLLANSGALPRNAMRSLRIFDPASLSVWALVMTR